MGFEIVTSDSGTIHPVKCRHEIKLIKEILHQAIPVPLAGRGFIGTKGGDHIRDGFVDNTLVSLFELFAGQHLASLGINHLTLFVHDIIVFDQMFTNIKIMGFYLALGVLDSLADHPMFDGLPLGNLQLIHDKGDPLRTENPQQVILKTQIKATLTRVTLATGAPAQLVVDTP